MLSGFHRTSLALTLFGALSSWAALSTPTARSQALLEGMPSIVQGGGTFNVGTAPIRVWHTTRGYGEETAETALGTHWAAETGFGLAFIDGQLRAGNSDSDVSANAGLGFRFFDDGEFGFPNIFGASIWYDGEDTRLNNWFNQIGVSLERLGPSCDFRINGYFPLEDQKLSGNTSVGTTPAYGGNILGVETLTRADRSLRIVDFEMAPRIFGLNAWVYGGGYYMDGGGVSDLGAKGGVRGYVTNDVAVDVSVTDDELFGTNTVFQVIWTPGRTTPGMSSWSHNLADRMREHVYRNMYVATRQLDVVGVQALTDVSGNEFRIVHVDSTAAPGGDGTFENPLNSLNDIQGNSQTGDIVLVHSGSSFTGESATLQDAQRFLGEGGNQTHNVVTSLLGTIALPETSAGSLSGAIPLIQNALGDAIILAGGNTDVSTLAGIEISNMSIDGGTRGIASPTGVGSVNINRMSIANTTGNGIDLTPLTETLANSTTRARMAVTIDDVTFDAVGGDDIHMDGTTTQTTNSGTVAISDYKSTNGTGTGIVLDDMRRSTTITNVDWDGGTTGAGALLIKDATAAATTTVNGTNVVVGGRSTSTETAGYAVRIQDSAGTHTLSGMTVTNTGGDTIQVTGGSANMNFTGNITQANNASVVQVAGGHTGSMTFTESTSGAGVITATNGDGLQFDNADGVYTFNSKVTLNGGDAGIDIVNGSAASISLANAEITDPSGVAVNVDGGSASMNFTGKITRTAGAVATVSVTGGHTGTLRFEEFTAGDGVIEVASGTGLQFNNADGSYQFLDKVVLNGGDAGIDVLNGSSGTFTFSDTDITNPTGTAVRLANSSANFTYTGAITTNSSRPVEIEGNTGGSVVFSNTSTINSTGLGIRSFNNTGGSVLFAGAVTLDIDDVNAAGVEIASNTAGSTQFNNIDIKTTSGAGFIAANSAGHTVTVLNAGNTIETTTGVGLSLNTVAVGASGVRFDSVTVDGATNGIVLNNVTGGQVSVGLQGNSVGDGGTIQNTTGSAIVVTNAANVSINHMNINATGAQGVDYLVSTSAASRLTLNGNSIGNTADETVRMRINGTATTANITVTNNNLANTSADEAFLLTTTDVTNKTVNFLMQGNTISNDDATAPAASINIGASTTFNANVLNNQFTNDDATPGVPFDMRTTSSSALARLNLNGNTASATSGDGFFLTRTAGTFRVEDLADVAANNTGGVNLTGTITNDAGNIPTP
ncbi:MAG: hypothetical protein KF688_06895 [Pirellulales bacterium]|nr:hypothetical protein [Pirellulales bacterium]